MKKFNITKRMLQSVALTLVTVLGLSLGLGSRVSAACVQYDPNSSISTPVFNNFCNVPQGIGNEPDFVRIRKNANGNPEDNQNNPVYSNAVTDACNAGDKFDIHTYIHNNAASGFNNNGAGTSIAKDVMLNMTAPLNAANNNFSFASTISASNAASVQDNATLNCGDKQVKLTIVPGSVHIYSQQYGWHDLADTTVNSTTKIGSPVLGSGDMWGCWEYRIVVVYQVTPQEIPTQSLGVCKSVDVTTDDTKRSATVNVNGDITNAQVIAYKIDFGDGTVSDKQTDTHTYASNGSWTIVASVQIKFADGHTEWKTADACKKQISFNATPPVTPTPTVLPNTGPGDIISIFGTVTIAGALIHRFVLSRRFNA